VWSFMQKIIIKDKNYPPQLKKIPDPPKQLYVEGNDNLSVVNNPLAVVGTRKISDYGRQMTEYFVKNLAKAGVTIISGLALGVDGLAHRVALENNGRTIAVLGSGLNHIYPTVHKKLAEKIVKSGGALVSEYSPQTPPYKSNFLARNRIISGLSLGILVIEAPKKSGALITADFALKQKRKVFVVPGRVYDKNSQGANELIKQGAQLVSEPKDILKILNIRPISQKIEMIKNLSSEEKIILKILTKEPTLIDKITRKTKMSVNAILSILTQMEIKGLVKSTGGNQYIRN